ncbi:hypothetical protein [Planctomicrobium sp. SH527]|uniref:hypothetical protein n=1 Tax=Planctomicrobium sp. SH527 TaxID=3448123 RepID=UPI003F5C1BBB
MAIKFRCPVCQQFLGIADHKAGALTECPGCGSSITVPQNRPEEVSSRPSVDALRSQVSTREEVSLSAFARGNGKRTSGFPQLVEVEQFGPPIVAAEMENTEVHVATEVIAGPLVTSRSSTLNGQLLKELNSLTNDASEATGNQNHSRSAGSTYRIGPALLLFIALLTSIAGGAIGYSAKVRTAAKPDVKSELSVPVSPSGKTVSPVAAVAQVNAIPLVVSYSDKAGVKKPDRGARVLLLPIVRNGTVKIAGNGFRVGADETDRRLVEAATDVFGGACGRADDAGAITLNAPKQGRFGLLVASRYQLRTSSEPLTDEARRFLETYFEQPEFVVGNVKYEFREIVIDSGSNYEREIHFPFQ